MGFDNDLEVVLAKWRTRLVERGASVPTGYGKDALDEMDRVMVKPMPPEIRRLYETFTPQTWALATGKSNEPALLPLENLTWVPSIIYHGLDEDVPELYHDAPPGPLEPGWLLFGGFSSNDFLIWTEEHGTNFKRAILFVYLYGGVQAGGVPLVLGKSLASWLDRLLRYDGYEYADHLLILFKSPSLKDHEQEFLAEHLALNPHDEGQANLMKRLSKP